MTMRLSALRGVSAQIAGRTFAGENDAGTPLDGRLYLAAPDRFRLDATTPRGRIYEVSMGGSKSTLTEGSTRTEVARTPHPLVSLFLGGNASTFASERRIDTGLVTLARSGRHICWVIGAKPGDTSVPQLWVDKETFLPIRLSLTEGEGDARRVIEWRFSGYDLVDAQGAFPRTLELRVGGVRVLHFSTITLDVHRVPDESLFSKPTRSP
jgi:outer membrane lipoprotein-sorting protein